MSIGGSGAFTAGSATSFSGVSSTGAAMASGSVSPGRFSSAGAGSSKTGAAASVSKLDSAKSAGISVGTLSKSSTLSSIGAGTGSTASVTGDCVVASEKSNGSPTVSETTGATLSGSLVSLSEASDFAASTGKSDHGRGSLTGVSSNGLKGFESIFSSLVIDGLGTSTTFSKSSDFSVGGICGSSNENGVGGVM